MLENHISQHARARPVTHFRRSGNSAPPAARRRSEATAQAAASDRRPADGAGAGQRGPRASERAGGLAPPLPALPGDLQGLGGGGGGGAMFVQEEKIFAGKVLRLHICASDGAEWLEEATEDTSVEQLKERCLKQCAHGSLEDPKSVTHHKLIHAASERVLSDAKTIAEENARAVSLPKMADVSAEEKKKQDQKAPTETLSPEPRLACPPATWTGLWYRPAFRDFQTELRKILLSLIEVAQKLLALSPGAVELFTKANAMLDEDEEERVDETALRQLTEMGFPESRAVKALRLNHMSVPQAMEWLIEHADDPAIDTPLPGHTSPGTAGAEASAEAAAGSSEDDEEAKDELTEIFKKIRRKRAFRADARAVISLMEMGFDEKEVMDALRVSNNQQSAACEWLLGDRKPSPEELDKGIDPNSPLFQAILDNPVVQLGLTNPKTLLAFEDMLENPLNSTQWMNDPETGPVMLQISRIFQTMNRT
ncbi:hypothetical protein QTO34_004908 [Cnephaeus nilssonii]|uniref:Ubiquitin-associated domain-containing protein 1 n=1 Tax=Cnephaeus nilssonii TaxID=3371016 RepID=A0AA40HMD1_CNENI|nr:hypothetical protein QTO34_004908 [Eptesicus nilssonii]